MNDVGLGRDLYRWSKRFGTTVIGVSLFGRAEQALPLATEALSLADPSQRPYVLCTLGTAYVKAGRALEGVPFLSESARLEADSAWSLAVRLRSLGDGLDAVGRVADARNAYRRAIDAAPGARPAALAAERLAALDARA